MKAPETLKEITLDYIISYCEDNKEVDWLVEVSETPVKPNKNGVIRKISFIEIRNAFVCKFFPDLAPKAAPKKPTMYERIAALKNKK